MDSPLSIGSLFSGIGGLELGLESCGLGPVLWQVEHDPFCRSILARHWPGAARSVSDVRVAGAANLAAVDLICAGFPCQPVSLAGRRKAREDARWLWPEVARIAGELGRPVLFLENVPGLLTASGGDAFGEVLGSLAALGYAAEWDCFRASDVGAPHRRERWFLLAYRDGERQSQQDRRGVEGLADAGGIAPIGRQPQRVRGSAFPAGARRRSEDRGTGRDVGVGLADPNIPRLEERQRVAGDAGTQFPPALRDGADAGARPAQPRMGRGPHGIPLGMDGPWPAGRGEPQHAWEAPRAAHKVAARPARLKALGNAVVPAEAALAWRVLWDRMIATGGSA